MTKIISIIVSILMAFMNLIIPAEKPFECETVKIKGVTYQNGFVQDNMHLMKEYNFHKETPIHLELLFDPISIGWFGLQDYYQLEDNFVWESPYTDYGQDVKENLFCPVEKWDYYHSFYGDSENYSYSFSVQRSLEDFKVNSVQNIDPDKFNEIVQFSADNEYGSSSKNRADTLSIPTVVYPRVIFKKESKDGLFLAKAQIFVIYCGNLYLMRYYNGSAGTMEVSVLPDELEAYFVSLLKSEGYEDLFINSSQAG